MNEFSPRTYSFDDFTLDLGRGCLLRAGQEIKLRPKSFDVLKYLVEHHGRLVSKSDLMQAVWPDAFVTDNSLVQCLIEVRRALGDDSQRYVKTVPRRGYIFEPQVNGSLAEGAFAEPAASSELTNEDVIANNLTNPEKQAPMINLPRFRHPFDPKQRWGLKSNRKIVTIGLLSITLVISLSYFWMIIKSNQAVARMPRTIAVLPFKPLVAINRDEAFELGMADNLITRLSGLKQLIVRPTSAIRKYTSLDQDPLVAGARTKSRCCA